MNGAPWARYYDRDGETISYVEHQQLMASDYRRVAEDTVFGLKIVTRWVGVKSAYNPLDPPPGIFETVLTRNGVSRQWQTYQTEAAARFGHDRCVLIQRWTAVTLHLLFAVVFVGTLAGLIRLAMAFIA